jgi:phage-related protein
MALVGEAHIVVRAITTAVADDIKRGFSGIGDVGGRAGSDAGRSFSKGFAKNNKSIFDSSFIKNAIAANKQLVSLTRTGRTVGTGLAALASGLGALITSVVSLGATVVAASPSLLVFASTLTSIAIGAITAKLALGGVGAAVGKLNKAKTKAAKDDTAQKRRVFDAEKALALVIEKNIEDTLQYDADLVESKKKVTEAQTELTKAIEEGNEELQQLGFDAEDAALAEKKAALELEKARETLQRTQDLPPNSRARKEAELAYAQAELALRKAKDANSDLAAEQDRLAKTGVAGTDVVISAQEKLNDALKSQQDLQQDRVKETRDALRSEADATLDLKRANEDLAKAQAGGGAGGEDPLEGLNESQKVFAKFLASLKPKVDAIKKAASDSFLPKLQEGITLVADKAFPVIETGVAKVGDALGDASITIAQAITDAGNLKDLAQVFEDAATNIRTLGDIIGNVYGIFLSTLIALQPLTDRFLKSIEGVTKKWEETLDTEEGQKNLENFFNTAGDVAKEIGQVFKEAFGALGVIVKANVGPGTGGQLLLDWLETSLKDFKEFGKTVEGQDQLKKFFKDSAENGIAAAEAIGGYGLEIIKAGADPNVKKFWDQLATGTDSFATILKNSNEAAPSLATLITKLLEIVAIFTDAGAIQVFFDTLSKAADVVIKVMENPVIAAIVQKVGQVLAFFSAVGLIFTALKFGVTAVIGGFAKIGAAVGKGVGFFKDPFSAVRGGSVKARTELQKQMIIDKQKQAAMKGIQISSDQAAAAIGIRLPAASTKSRAALGLSTVAANTKSAALRGLSAAGTAAGRGLAAAGRGLSLLGGPIGILLLLVPLIIQNWDKIVAFFKELGPNLVKIFTGIWDKIKEVVPTLFDKIKEVVGNVIGWVKENWPLILAIFTGPFGLIILAIVKNWDTILEFIKGLPAKLLEIGSKIWDWIVDTFKKAVDLYIGAWKAIFDFVKDLGRKLLDVGKKIWDWIVDVFITVKDKYIEAWTAIFTFIGELGGKLLEKGKAIWDWIVDVFITAKDNFIANWTAIFTFIGGLAAKLLEKGAKIWDWITDKLGSAFTALKLKFEEVVTWVKGIPKRFLDSAGNVFGFLKSSLEASWQAAKDWWNKNVAGKGFTLGGFTVGKGPLAVDIPKIDIRIPQLAQGGIVMPSRGGTLAQIAEAGRPERIEPLDPDGLSKRDKAMIQLLSGGGGSGPVINVYPSQGMNETELAEIVSRKIAFAMRKGAA